MRRKFVDGTRVRSREEGAASFRGRTGTVVSYWGESQYLVRFDDGREEYAYSYWLEAI